MNSPYKEEYVEQVKAYYKERARHYLNIFEGDVDKATKEASQATYQRFEKASKRSLRRWTDEFRYGGVVNPAAVGWDPEPIELEEEESDVEEDPHLPNEEEFDDSQLEDYLLEKGYVYNSEDDTYIFDFEFFPRTLVLPGTMIRSMKRAYSNWDGEEETINATIRPFPVDRRIFMAIKRSLGWTHDSDPWTEEEKDERNDEDLISELDMMHDQRLHKKAQKKLWRKTRNRAKKYLEWETYFKEPLVELIEDQVPQYQPPTIHLQKPDQRWAWVVSVFDLHLGMYGFGDLLGEGYDISEAKRRLKQKTEFLLSKIRQRGKPESIFLLLGGDFYHIDNLDHTTTAGTTVDHDKTYHEIVYEGNELIVSYIDMLRQIAPVKIFMVPGNHDEKVTFHSMQWLDAWYRGQDDVEMVEGNRFKHRMYYKWGATVFGVSHGRNESTSDLDSILMREARGMWGQESTRCAAFFIGDKHNEKTIQSDESGVLVYRVPALSSHSEWSYKRAFYGRAALSSYILDYDIGVDGIEYAPVVE